MKKDAIARFLDAYHASRGLVPIWLKCDENLHVLIAVSFGSKGWAGQVVFGEVGDEASKISRLTPGNFDHQSMGLLAATRRRLLREGIIKGNVPFLPPLNKGG